MTQAHRRRLIFLHPSDEMYGADRILLEVLSSVPNSVDVQVWLPTDLPHPQTRLCDELQRRNVLVRHLDLPVLRRAYRTPSALWRLAMKSLRVAAELRRVAPEVVYCTTSAAFLMIASARLARVPKVVGHVQEFWSSSDALVLGILARRTDRVIATSHAVAAALPGALRCRTSVVQNVTIDPGTPAPTSGRSGPLRYLVASRWTERKGHRTLLAAWDRAGCPGELIVLGAAPMSGDSVDVRKLAGELSAPESVIILGEVADPSKYITDSDVVLVPSDEPEGFGLVAIEAFARARPVVASTAGGLAEIITDGHDGWLFPARDIEALAALLRRLDRSQVQVAGAQARTSYESRYCVERYVQQWQPAMNGILPTPSVAEGSRKR